MENKLYVGRKTKIIIIIAMVLFTLLCIMFIFSATENLESEKRQYLSEVSKQNVKGIEDHVEGDMRNLESISVFVGAHDVFDVSHALPILKVEADKNEFKRMGIAFSDGMCITTDDEKFDVSSRDWFQKAIAGENAIDAPLKDIVDEQFIVVMSTPIVHKGEVVAVLFAVESEDGYRDILQGESFGGEGYSYMINREGKPIVKTTHENSAGNYNNLFNIMRVIPENNQAVDELQEDVKAGKDGSIKFLKQGQLRIASYTKTDVNDWYVVSVVPTEVISKYAQRLVYQISIAVVSMMIFALLGGYIISRIYGKSQKALAEIAFKDQLTGHDNWNKFTLDCNELFQNENFLGYALVQFDVNDFKVFNDVYGYEIGSELLQHIGKLLEEECKDDEHWTRISMDHFIMLVKYTTDESITDRIDIISQNVEKFIKHYHIELSFGIYKVTDFELPVSAMNDKASLARLAIKKAPRNSNYSFFSEAIRWRIAWEREIETSFSKAIADKEFQVFLQPKYSFKDPRVVGAEALVRWFKPDQKMVTPDNFIPLLEKNGKIKILDLYVFEEVCILLNKWNRELPISVNFSRVDFKQNDLEEQLLVIMKKYNINPKLLEIEITESAVIDELENLKKAILNLKEIGLLVSIDDFGSGYSSLNTLRNLNIDVVKLDKGFLDETLEEEKGKIIIKNLLIMAKELSLVTVAEGVETEEHVEFLLEAGCDIAQGYFYAKPLNVKDFETLINMG